MVADIMHSQSNGPRRRAIDERSASKWKAGVLVVRQMNQGAASPIEKLRRAMGTVPLCRDRRA
jgi:hypothetical protein